MAQGDSLQAAILGLCDVADAMLLANLLETQKAVLLRKRLLACADQARDSWQTEGERRMRRAEAKLASRFPPTDE